MDQLAEVTELLTLARRKKVMIATAESCTGGLIAGALTDVAGSSDVFDRGFVTYSNNAKIEMLGVAKASLAEHGAVSEVVAREMAAGALDRSDAAIAVSVTGIAGPGGSEFKPEGLVWFGLAVTGRGAVTEKMQFGAIGRDKVRFETVSHALKLLKSELF